MRTLLLLTTSLIAAGCGDSSATGGDGPGGNGSGAENQGAGQSTGGNASGAGGPGGSSNEGGGGGSVVLPGSVDVSFENNGASGMTRVNFALPLTEGTLSDATLVAVSVGGSEVSRASRGLGAFSDGSFRSVQLQIEIDPAVTTGATISLGAPATAADLPLVPVEDTLIDPDGESGPRVYTLIPASWLSASGFAGPLVPEADVTGDLDAWNTLCDYDEFDTGTFLAEGAADTRAVWLYDRGTAMVRGYARRGTLSPLASAYIETSMYRNLITGSGTSARNGLPEGSASDPKYQYAQNLALHYLLTGDDRFRESAEDMALGMTELWPSPEYAGGDDMWTERNAGFALLAYTWAAMVSDDQSATLWAAADDAVNAYLDVQATYPIGYDDTEARCFAHHGDAHDPDEGNPYFGCSPWMSAILADGLDVYARERNGASDAQASDSLVMLGRIIAREGLDDTGNPFYWMGVDTPENAIDDYLEHIGESAYTVALAYARDGSRDTELRAVADGLVTKLKNEGEVGQLRSFNWQCRSAVMTPSFLLP